MQRCKHLGICGEICWHGRRRCIGLEGRTYEPARKFKAFGWEIEVEFRQGHTKSFHYRGCTEGGARRKGMLKTHAMRIVACEPITEEQWVKAYGLGFETGGN